MMPSRPVPATILVVEDDTDTREFYEALLSLAGHLVVSAADARGGLQQMAKQSVDAVVLDRRLPDMDGLAACQHIRAHFGPDLPIIIATANNDPEMRETARALGATDVLRKPFPPDVLLNRLAALLADKHTR
jgi:DNA-binding response OmpR family regulator